MYRYELLPKKSGETLHQIRALVDIPKWGVKKGDLGGFIESEKVLAQFGDGWVGRNSKVYGEVTIIDGHVEENNTVSGNVYMQGGVINDSTLSGNLVIDGDVSILNSTIEHGQLSGKGSIVDSELVNIRFRNEYVLNRAKVKSLQLFVCFARQVWSDVVIILESGKLEHDTEIRDVQMRINFIHGFQKAEIEYVIADSPSLNLAIGDSDVYTKNSVVIKGNSEAEQVVIHCDVLQIMSSKISGTVELDGRMTIVDSTIQDDAFVNFSGKLQNVTVSDLARIDVPIGAYMEIKNKHFNGDVVYTG